MTKKHRPTPDSALSGLMQPEGVPLRRAAVLSALASVIWPLQAALVAWGLAAGLQGAAAQPLVIAGVYLALGLLRAGLVSRSEALLFAAGSRILRAARTRMVLREAASTDGPGAGALAALAGEKLDLLLPYVTRYAAARARVMVMPLAILALAFCFSWAVGVVLLITGPLIPVFQALVGLAAREASQRQMAEVGSLNDLLVERLSALVDLRLLGAQGAVLAGFADRAEGLRARTMAVLRIAFLSSTVLELFAAIGVAMVAVYVGFSLLGALDWGSYGAPLTPAAGIFLLLLTPNFYQPLRDLSAAWHDKAAAGVVADELAAWEASPGPALPGDGAAVAPLPGPASVAAAGVTLARPGGRVIAVPDFTLMPGERLALTGHSGAGKTTLLQALAGRIIPRTGSLNVAGVRLEAVTADAWRARLGWMPQAPHFLNASLRHNITLSRPSDLAGDLTGALTLARAADVVAVLPGGLQARLGETGGGLSGGEARRITLARAVYAAPDVLLADEPTADLDAETAAEVTDGLMALAAQGCTLIVATHDPVLIARLGRSVVLEAA
jgi:ATP-binding cassette subfamily C protein CydD